MPHLPASMRDNQEHAALLDWYQAPMTTVEYEPLLKAHKALAETRSAFTKAYEEATSEGVIPEKTSHAAGDEFSAAVSHAEGERCPRCWNWRKLGDDGLCCRCHDAVEGASEQG